MVNKYSNLEKFQKTNVKKKKKKWNKEQKFEEWEKKLKDNVSWFFYTAEPCR